MKATVAFGKQATKTLTVTNTGGAAATLKLKEHAGGTTIAAQGAALRRVKGADWHLSMTKAPAAARAAAASPPAAPAAGDAWQAAPDLPVPTQDNSVDSYDGKIYSGFGFNGTSDTNELYSYDPRTGAWTQRASASDTREAPAHGFVNGKLYVVGGWNANGVPDRTLEVYDPSTDTWTTGTSAPVAYAGSSSAVLDDQLYVVGGCLADSCGEVRAGVYDPADDSWSQIADYPEPAAFTSCAGIQGKLYCAGGITDHGDIKSTYVYDPAADS
ncbi:Kelch repeat-containing protein [Streptomyces sp. NBC_01483]|uniref:Kelch repeat-containing protein n=1 Tax=Streptomyces sp. NBC_01483 TaxID=2903883 RepID=UPI002E31C484|nr:kelch repeat-containing protein [Streptomyces sp. NBC_01483]